MRARTRVYRALLWFYPRRFRREYGAAMLQLYTDLERERATRRFRRAFAELALTVPYQYWEALMATTPLTRATITVVITAVIAAASIALGAAVIGLLVLLLLAWELYAVLRMRRATPGAHTWWHFVVAGIGMFALVFVIFALPWPQSWRAQVPGELAFYSVLAGISASIVLVTAGLLMGLGRLAPRRRGA
jgi:hypothetical protein